MNGLKALQRFKEGKKGVHGLNGMGQRVQTEAV